ncbi:hypothetical protein SLE2022_254150 [Rubroshorea leprosula]
MESFDGAGFAAVGSTARKKRSIASRRPCAVENLQSYNFLLSLVQPIGSVSNEDQHFKNGSNGLGSDNKLKLKLKLGGVTHTIHTKSMAEDAFGGVPTVAKSSHFSGAPQIEKSLLQGKADNFPHPSDKGKGHGVFSGSSSVLGEYSSWKKVSGISISGNETEKYEPTRKSKRVPKRRVLDVGFNSDEEEEDAEMRYLGRLKASTGHANYEDEMIVRNERGQGIYDDRNYVEEEEEPVSDDDSGFKRRRLGKGSIDSFMEGRNESTPTTRNRALQSGKDGLSLPGTSLIEFPDGLPPAPSKKQEKLTDVEQQLKKAEAAQRRRMQSEKAAREAEAEAIRKILGQDSGRKKKEEKIKKQRDELAQEKASKSNTLASNTVRWVMGPTGTTVIFSEDIGLPNIFSSVPCSYPPPREKCAGPNCTNTYKYRDSKSKLPLCSLNCYKAIHEKTQPLITC